jgi:hypothetical protein
MARLPLFVAGSLSFLSFAALTDGATSTADPAARGIDAFIHGADSASPGAMIPLELEVYGFPTVSSLSPLADAEIEAVWNPEKLGVEVAVAPPGAKGKADANGRVHLDVPMPPGDPGDLELLIGLRHGSHARTKTMAVHRVREQDVELSVSEQRVVPGGATTAWATVRDRATGMPLANTRLDVALLEGGVARFEKRLVTDASGVATVRVPIPRTNEPAWSWDLEAKSLTRDGRIGGGMTRTLSTREETPGTPSLYASWDRTSALAGDHVNASITLRDATGEPLADQAVRYWIGPRGTKPPKDDEAWEQTSTRAMTDASGEVKVKADAPSTVVRGVGSSLTIVARANVDGRDLKAETTLSVGVLTSSASLQPEAGVIIPGLSQRMLLRVRDGHDRPVVGGFVVEGDELKSEVRTNALGEAEVLWTPPVDVGGQHGVGACAGGVAASVRVRMVGSIPALAPRTEPFETCVSVDREASAILTTDHDSVRIGDSVHVTIATRADKDKPSSKPWSVLLKSPTGGITTRWIDDGARGGDLTIPVGTPGIWTLSAVQPGGRGGGRAALAALLVTPKVLPKLRVTTSGQAVPGGAIDVDAVLEDERGQPVQGSIASVMIDARGGGSLATLRSSDLRRSLCAPFDVNAASCDKLVEGDPSFEATRRADLAVRRGALVAPFANPAAHLDRDLRKAFAEVVRALEGAVFQASADPERLRDVRRKGKGGKFELNPELMTLVTGTMAEAPETPGGEPIELADLVAIDPQVTFDRVARRITRLKLFKVLAAVRAFRREKQLDPDEPALASPNALLRRLVREGRLQEEALLDPWGGTIQFTKASSAPIPFLTAVRGFDLRAPGPDGRLGSGDDVKDPFERVLKQGSPYARAVDEDRLVDAKLEVEVSDETVAAWQHLFDSLTGTSWGNQIGEGFGAGGLGLSGIGEGGGGRGEGIGLGSVGTIGHGSGSGIETGAPYWSPPVRTDARGHVHFHVPIPGRETTYQIGLVGLSDGGYSSTTTVDVPSTLPLSATVEAGARWVEGDAADVTIVVHNRTLKPIVADVTIGASGVLVLDDKDPKQVSVPPESSRRAHVRAHAPHAGEARLDLRVTSPGLPEELVTHRWDVIEAGEATDFTSARWIDQDADLSLTLPPDSIRLHGAPVVVLERGGAQALEGALNALDPDELLSPSALADAIEVASRVRRFAITKSGETSPLAERALAVARRAVGKLGVYKRLSPKATLEAARRARPFVPDNVAALLPEASECPEVSGGLDARLEAIESEPPPIAGAAKSCWDALVSDVTTMVLSVGDAQDHARLVLALAERPHRSAAAAMMADRLREKIALKPTGAIAVPSELGAKRSSRAIIFSALLRSARIGHASVASPERLTAWVLVQRDAQGGFGSSLATRSAVRALSNEAPEPEVMEHVRLRGEGFDRAVDVAAGARVVVELPASAKRVNVSGQGPGVVARFERPVLRLWSHPPSAAESSLHVDVAWPVAPRAGATGVLRLSLRKDDHESVATNVRVPLPPGVTLAEPVADVAQIQGQLWVRRTLDASELPIPIEIPVRFGLPGTFTAPEVVARVAFEERPRAIAPARPLTVLPRAKVEQ